jgi:hypothetical protein
LQEFKSRGLKSVALPAACGEYPSAVSGAAAA